MITKYTEYIRYRNMEATFRGNHNTIDCQSTYNDLTKSRILEATLRGNHETMGYPNCNGYYIY